MFKQRRSEACKYIKNKILRMGILIIFCLFCYSAQAAKPIKPVSNNPSQFIGVSPLQVLVPANSTVLIQTTYSDSDGVEDMSEALIRINVRSSGRRCFYAYYDAVNNLMYLRDDLNKKWHGGFHPGSANLIENSYSILDCSQSSVIKEEGNLIIIWAVQFKSSFIGLKKMFHYVSDGKKPRSRWAKNGTCEITAEPVDNIAPTGLILINGGSEYVNTNSVLLTLGAEDNAGGSGLSLMQFSNDGVQWSDSEPYAVNKTWFLSGGDGEKFIYVKYADAAGNWSPAYFDRIVLDMSAPEIIVFSPQRWRNRKLSEEIAMNITKRCSKLFFVKSIL